MSDEPIPPVPAASAAGAPWRDQRGQGLSEYALLVGAVAVLLVSCATLFRTELSAAISAVGTHIGTRAALLDAGGGNGGSSADAPGHGNTPPGQGGTPPGQADSNPGRGGGKK